MSRPSIRLAVEIIALNDDYLLDPEEVEATVTVQLVASIFNTPPARLARRIVAFREAVERGEITVS